MSSSSSAQSFTNLLTYSGLSGLLFYLSTLEGFGATAIIFALSPLFIYAESEKGPLFSIAAALIPLAIWSLFYPAIAIWAFLAWTLFILLRPLLGRQRAYLAFLFLWLSGECLPYYLPLKLSLSPSLSHGLQEVAFLKSSFLLFGFSGLSLLILLLNLFAGFLFSAYQKNKNFKPGLILTWALFLFIPIIISLTAEGTLADFTWPDGDFDQLRNADRFLARMSFFIAFFLLLFALVRKLLPSK